MLHNHGLLSRRIASPAAMPGEFGALPPMAPAEYLALRRKASGLSIERAAALIAVKADDQADARGLIRMLETPGVTARHVSALDTLCLAYPLDDNVYFALMHESAERHPAICRACGCSQNDACDLGDNRSCAWALPTRCTSCSNGERF